MPQPCLSPEASEQTAFLQDTGSGVFTPLVTAAPGFSNVLPSGSSFGEDEQCAGLVRHLVICGPQVAGATADLSHVVFESHAALTSPASGGLYEWSAGKPPSEQLAPVGVLPPAEGGGPVAGTLGLNGNNTRHAISEDGSRVFFGKPGKQLYVRDVVKPETLLVAPTAEFQDASSDGSRVFYTEGEAHGGGGHLYECAISEVAGELKCATTELASGVSGLIPGSSEDGSYLYFVSSQAKPSTTLQGPEGVEGSPNLYVRHEGATSLIAVLSPSDEPDWDSAAGGLGGDAMDDFTARVSPNGGYLAFMSQRSLTGYDNEDASSQHPGERPDEEVYEYDAASRTLVCASCDPTGARPVGSEYKNAEFVGGERVWQRSTWLAADVPAWNVFRNGSHDGANQPRYLSNSGRLFFDARDPLVSKAVGGSWDVYEYEPQGVPRGQHACAASSTSGSDVFKPGGSLTAAAVNQGSTVIPGLQGEEGAGCLALLSSGESGQESAFLDATETGGEGPGGEQLQEGGGEVFFMTAARLSKADTDNAYDVYDAHECTTESKCLPSAAGPPSECATEASCKPSPEPQPGIYGPPASATFNGPGNLAPPPPSVVKKATTKTFKCKRGEVKKKIKKKQQCVKVKSKKKAKKTNRRTK